MNRNPLPVQPRTKTTSRNAQDSQSKSQPKISAPPAKPVTKATGSEKTKVAQKKIVAKPQRHSRLQLPPGRPVPRLKPEPMVRARNDQSKIPANHGTRLSNSDQIRSRLKNKSPWYQSIDDPIRHGGSKIPDAFGTATATNQMVFDWSVPINANGVAGLRVASPYPNSDPTGTYTGLNYQVTYAASTASDIAWSDGTTPGLGAPFPSNSTFIGFAQGVRVVSACVMAMPEMSTLSDQGEMVAFVTPFGAVNQSPLPYALYESLYDSTPVALNKHKSVRASWYPASMIDADGFTRDYRDFISPAITNSNSQFPFWEFGVVLSGAAASSGMVRYRIVINYEWVPQYNALDVVSQGPSPVDIEEEEYVLSEMQAHFPVTSIVPDKQMSTAPTSAPVQSGEQNDTGFGFFAEILREVGPMVLQALV